MNTNKFHLKKYIVVTFIMLSNYTYSQDPMRSYFPIVDSFEHYIDASVNYDKVMEIVLRETLPAAPAMLKFGKGGVYYRTSINKTLSLDYYMWTIYYSVRNSIDEIQIIIREIRLSGEQIHMPLGKGGKEIILDLVEENADIIYYPPCLTYDGNIIMGFFKNRFNDTYYYHIARKGNKFKLEGILEF